jgi:hypothetical protein
MTAMPRCGAADVQGSLARLADAGAAQTAVLRHHEVMPEQLRQ